MEPLPEVTPINCYNVTQGKLNASIRWLIGRVYGSNAPDLLQNPLHKNENRTFQLKDAVVTALTNASLYSNAAAKIFRDQSLMNKSHSAVLRTLANYSVPITISGEEANINESILASVKPLNQAAHLAVIDALMIAHMRSIITIDGVVNAVQKYTTVDKREEPVDGVDALLFWINKICLLVRDDMEKCNMMSKGNGLQYAAVVPEMEDLYEDMCDGACLCALAAFYRPNELNLRDICFNDPMSIADCQYNLLLLKKFCAVLSNNPFHFEVEDILYLHECLQPNVNAFLADLFCIFEGDNLRAAASPVDPSPTHARCFVPMRGIPDLRSANAPAKTLSQMKAKFQADTPRAFSTMSSDSLMTNRSNDTLRHAYNKKSGFATVDTTNFGELGMQEDRLNGAGALSSRGSYIRSDSMPAASIRLALEEKRREHEKKRYLETNQSESERVQKQKDAFFTLMQRLEKSNGDMRARAASEVGDSQSHPVHELMFLKETVQNLKKQMQEMTIQQEQLSRQFGEHRQMTHATSQPAIHSEFALMHEASETPANYYATLPHNMAKSVHQGQQQHTYATPYGAALEPQMFPQAFRQAADHNQLYPVQPVAMQSNGHTQGDYQSEASIYGSRFVPQAQIPASQFVQQMPAEYILQQQEFTVQGPRTLVPQQFVLPAANVSNANTFRLHQNDASSSRLDPSLEINRNLTNWGMTYRAGQLTRPQRRTWENGTFVKSDLDLVNQPDLVPDVSHYQREPQGRQILTSNGLPVEVPVRQTYDYHQNNTELYLNRETEPKPSVPIHQQTPPKDPVSFSSSPVETVLNNRKQSLTRASQFIVDDALTDRPVVGVTPEMEAKREALLAKTLRRREQIEQKAGELEAKNAERRQAELEKQEAAEQRKRDREAQRQKILEDYKRKKLEKELENNGSRGHSQPPVVPRPKSVAEMNPRTKRTGRFQNSFEDGSAPSSARIPVPSTAEPTLKLFSKYVHKSNRSMIINALQYSVFPGAVWDKHRTEVLGELAKSDSKHFLLLFRDQKCRYIGAYSWDQQSDTCHRIHGKGPNICHESMMDLLFKYDSGAKVFTLIPAKHLSATIDGFTLKDQYVQAPKIPHSSSNVAR